ncbi:hypothetical protein Tco_0868528 [Tanacetum coccineum]
MVKCITTSWQLDHPLMLATGRYAKWQSCFLKYIDTRPNGDALRKCILQRPYTPSILTISAVPATDDTPAVPERTAVETILNMSPENKAHCESEKEAIHLLLIGIGDEIYSTILQDDEWNDKKQLDSCYDEVNEIRAERIAKNTNLLARVATAQQYPYPYYQAPKPNRSLAQPSKQSSSTRSNATTKFKGKEIAKAITPLSESAFEEDSDPEQA